MHTTSTHNNPAPSYYTESYSGIPVDVQFRHMRESKRVIGVVQQLMEKFEKYDLYGARVTVTVDETHHREGKNVFQIKVRLNVPGERLYVARSQERTGMHDGVYVAIADCFEGIERQLNKKHARRSSHRLQQKAA